MFKNYSIKKAPKRFIAALIIFAMIFSIVNFESLEVHAANYAIYNTASFSVQAKTTSSVNVLEATGLPNNNVAMLIQTGPYDSATYHVWIYDYNGTKLNSINVSSLMTSITSREEIHMLALKSGNILLTYNKSDSSASGSSNAFFIVINQIGTRITDQTQINTTPGDSLTRYISMAQLTNDNIAFGFQLPTNSAVATRVFTESGTAVTGEILVANTLDASSGVAPGENGSYLLTYSDRSASSTSTGKYKIYNSSGAVTASGTISAFTYPYVRTLTNGNFIVIQGTSVLIMNGTGSTVKSFTLSDSTGRGSCAIIRNSGEEGFVIATYDQNYIDATNNWETNWTWSNPVNLNIKYYDNNGVLKTTTNSVDSGNAYLKFIANDWDYDYTNYECPSYNLYPGYSEGFIEFKFNSKSTNNVWSSSIDCKLFNMSSGAVPDTTAPTLSAGTATRTSDTAGEVKFSSDEAGQYYYSVVTDGADAPNIDTSGTGIACVAGENTITNPTGLSAGAKDIYIKVKDEAGNVSAALKIDIAVYIPPNTAPIFVGETTTLIVEKDAQSTDIKGLFHVSDSDSGQTLTWTAKTAPSHGTLSITGATAPSGGTDIAPNGTITYTPSAGYIGSDSFTVQVSDGSETATKQIAVTVMTLTHAETPLINTQPNSQTFAKGQSAILSVTASGVGELSYQWYSNTINSTTGGTLIPNATESSLSVPTAETGTKYYFCVVTNTDNSATGNKTASVTTAVAKIVVSSIQLIHNNVSIPYATIQQAANASVDGDIIDIGAGVYTEQISITKNITIQGAGKSQTVIQAPNSDALVQSGESWKNLKNQDIFAVIAIKTSGSGTVTVKNLTIDGRDQGKLPDDRYPDKNSYAYDGIAVLNSNAVIEAVLITGVRELATDFGAVVPSGYLPSDQPSGINHNEGIFAESAMGAGQHTLTVTNCTITKFQKTAILAWGPTLTVNINNNIIQGYGQTLYSTGNGIQIASSDRSSMGGANGDRRGTTGIIKNNQILDMGIVVPQPGHPESYLNLGLLGSTAILLWEAGDDFVIDGNTITRANTTKSWHNSRTSNDGGWTNGAINAVSSKNVKVLNNTVSGYDDGISLETFSQVPFIVASGNILSGNTFDYISGTGDDKFILGDNADTILYCATDCGVDTLTNFWLGDRIYITDISLPGAVNGLIGGLPTVNFTGGSVTTGDGTNVPAKSVQVFADNGNTMLYIDTNNAEGAPELTIRLEGVYSPENFALDGGYIKFKHTYSIESIDNQTMTALNPGYTSNSQEVKMITIKKTGTADLTNLSVSLSGGVNSNFVVTAPIIANLNSQNNSTTFTIKAKDGLVSNLYTETVTISADSMTAVTFTVSQLVYAHAAAPVITGDISDKTVKIGDAANLTVEASGGVELSYKWYINSTDSTSGGTLIEDATSASYNASTAQDGTTYYYCIITNTDNTATGTKTASVTSRAAKVVVNKIPLAVSLVLQDKIYDGTTTAVVESGSLEGILSGDDVSLNLDNVTAVFDDSQAGVNKTVQVNGLALKGSSASKYSLNEAASLNGKILSKPITVKADTKSKVYGEADPTLTYQVSGLVNSDTLSGNLVRAEGENVGQYDIAQGTLANSNYAITFEPAKLAITPKPITVTADEKSKVYGETDPQITYKVTGLVGSDALSGSLARIAGESAGQYDITQGTLANSNYEITFVSAKFTVALKGITITADAKSKTYGEADPIMTYTVTGLVGSDKLTGELSRNLGENAGQYDIIQGTLSAGSNYSITYNPAKLTINKKSISVTADAKTKTYSDNDPALTYKVTGLVGSDALMGNLVRAAGENVGQYDITQGTLANNNYVITYNGAKLSIDKKALTITADTKSKVYGEADPTLTYQVSGLVNSDTLSGNLVRAEGENVGQYDITQGTLANSNYAITFEPAKLAITPKPITVTADAKSKVYGETDPQITYKVTGLVGSDALSGSLARIAGESAGQYDITQGTLANSNYEITFVSAKFTVALKGITITADAKSKTYGEADPIMTYTVTGLVGSDKLTGELSRNLGENAGQYDIIQGTLSAGSNYSITYNPAKLTINKKSISVTADAKTKTYGDNDPALTYNVTGLVGSDALSGNLVRAAGENVGQYDITQGTLANNNYVITYNGAKLSIDKKALTITADAKSKIYGDNNPSLTVSYSGFVNGETEANLTLKPTANTAVTAVTAVGEYDITVSGAVSGNYEISYVPAKLTVQKRSIAVKADDKQKINGDADPALTYKITNGNLVNGDTFAGALQRVSGENLTSSPQTYDIEQGTLALNNNYALSYVKGIFTIVPSTNCVVSKVNSPTDITFTGNSITKMVAYDVDKTLVELTISDYATWKLYSDVNCTEEIADKIFRLNVGSNTAYIKVTAQDATTSSIYTISIYRKNDNTNLSALSLSSGELSPVFNKDTVNYTSIIKGNVDSITATASVEDTKATIKVNGIAIANEAASQAIGIALGSGNEVKVVVTAEDTIYTKTYTIGITKLNNNNNLVSLTEGTLSPSFDKDTLNYTMTVDSTVSQINLKPIVEDTGRATVKINGLELSNVLKSLPINLNPGVNIIKINVIAEDGSIKTYTLTVTRTLPANVKSSNANLLDLTPSEGTLSPAFDKVLLNYTLALPNTVESVTLKPTAEDASKAGITVNDIAVQSGTASSAITLNAGERKAVQVNVTAENGTKKTYSLNITRALPDASSDNSLINMSADTGVFNTAFHKDITVYSQTVGFNVVNIKLTPTVSDANATVTVNGKPVQNGEASSVALRVGANTITVDVTAQNGAVKTYTFMVTRYSNRLIDLGISSGSLSPQFDRNELLYTSTVENSVSSIKLTPSLERPLSTVKVNAEAVQNMTASQDIPLAVGENKIPVVVTAEDGTIREYKLIVVRKPALPSADQDVELFKKLIDEFDSDADDSELIAVKSAIENTVEMYEKFTDSQKTSAEVGNSNITSRKDKLYDLYNRLMSAIKYINKQATSTYYVEATKGFITNLNNLLQADDGQQLTIRLNVSPVEMPRQTTNLTGKTVSNIYDLNITEQITRLSDGSVLAVNENIQPKAGQKITVKIKVPSNISDKKGLDIAYIDSDGNATTQNASIVSDGLNVYLVFEAEHFSHYAIVHTPDPVKQSTDGKGSNKIKSLAAEHENYVNGYADGTFKPENSITRAEAAAILSRISDSYNANLYYASSFSDLDSNGWYLNEVGYGSANGLLAGYEDGTFRPDAPIKRAEFAVIISRYLKLDSQMSGTSLSDVSGHWAQGYISALFTKGLISGYEDGTFRPDESITRAEAVKIINAAISRTPSKEKVVSNIGNYQVPFADVDQSHWAYHDILEAAILHRISDFH